MIARLIWRESWMNHNKDSFWVECTDQEVTDKILPLKSNADFLKEIEFNREPSMINENLNERIYTSFFLISVDLTEILSFNWVYPLEDCGMRLILLSRLNWFILIVWSS